MNIRPFIQSDTNSIVDLSLRAWAPVFASLKTALGRGLFEKMFTDWRSDQQEAVTSALESEDMRVWVADLDGAAVGFVAAQLHTGDEMGEIYMIAVDPDYQRRGIGRALTDTAVDWMKSAGATIAMVETGGDPGHAPARRAYESAGFAKLPIARYFKRL